MTTLSHLTLNTGHLTKSPRAEVDQHAIDLLQPLLDADGGPIPGMAGWYIDMMRPLGPDGARLDGGAFFQIADEPATSAHTRPVVMAVAAWREDRTAEAWQYAISGYRGLESVLKKVGLWLPPPERPPAVPWLAVWLTPFIGLTDVQLLGAFGDFERCVAWALME